MWGVVAGGWWGEETPSLGLKYLLVASTSVKMNEFARRCVARDLRAGRRMAATGSRAPPPPQSTRRAAVESSARQLPDLRGNMHNLHHTCRGPEWGGSHGLRGSGVGDPRGVSWVSCSAKTRHRAMNELCSLALGKMIFRKLPLQNCGMLRTLGTACSPPSFDVAGVLSNEKASY
jgi:hypothetical protein